MVEHTVSEGDSISSIAGSSGLTGDRIWNHPENAVLRGKRRRRDALAPGDKVIVPELERKEVTCATDARYLFRRKTTSIEFRLQLFDIAGKPLVDRPPPGEAPKGLAYTLDVDGRPIKGRIDPSGLLVQVIPHDAKRGRLMIDGEPDRWLLFGGLDPAETDAGLQHRLSNMGFSCAGDAGAIGRSTVIATARFQRFAGLEPTGKLDDDTREAIRACHDDGGEYRWHADVPPPLLS